MGFLSLECVGVCKAGEAVVVGDCTQGVECCMSVVEGRLHLAKPLCIEGNIEGKTDD